MQGLILIDIQQAFDAPGWGARNNPGAEAQAARLLAHWRKLGWPPFHVRHLSTDSNSPLHPAKGMCGFKPEVAPLPGAAVYEKSVNSAFIGTSLEADLRAHGITDLLICGLTTPHCVSTSVRMAANLGFQVTLAHDACAATANGADTVWRNGDLPEPQAIHNAAIDHLSAEFARVRAVDDILRS